MKRILLAVPFIVALVAFAAFTPAAHASGSPPPGFHIEVQMLHCIDKHQPCNTFATASNSIYTQVEVDNFTPGMTKGTPDHVVFACGRAYVDQNGIGHIVAQHSFAGFDPGTISGFAELQGKYDYNSTYAVSNIKNVVAYDAVTGDTAYVSGRMATNNKTALRISGGFELYMTGPIYDEYTDANGNMHSTVVGNGKRHCDGTSSFVTAPFASGPYFVSVV